jgi:hypothetical protein
MQKYYQARSTDKALHTPWCHFIFGLWRVSPAEYILVLRVYSLLLQMTSSITDAASTIFSLRGMMTRLLGMVSVSVTHLEYFCGIWLWTGYVSELLVLWFQNYIASATLNLVCNNWFELRCMWAAASYLWNVVTGDVLCWIMYDLGLLVGWFEILHDFVDHRYHMCSSVEIWPLLWLFLSLCSYNLEGSVTQHHLAD